MKKVGLVLEGGGQRGIFTSGVLDAFMAVSYTHLDVYKRQINNGPYYFEAARTDRWQDYF